MAKKVLDKAAFEEKYALYGDMLYRLGLIYFGPGEDYLCQEAMEEAFLWLMKKKKGFKNSEWEKIKLLSYMVLICKSKLKKKPKGWSEMDGGQSINTLHPEFMDMLDALYRLPQKYKPVLHLALYEGLDEAHIAKIISMPWPVVQKLLKNGTELTEMVLERKLYKEYYCRMMNECRASSCIKEEVYFHITEGKPHVKTYLSPMQKGASVMAAAILLFVAIRLYPVLKPVISTKYAFMNGTIHSITLNNIYI